jgi:small neutral amino acid transporter SnatA (MarC family)
MSIPFTFGITIAVSVVAGGLILIGYGLSRLKSRQ